MKMFELVSWFQLEYPELIQAMKNSNHHLNAEEHLDLKLLSGIEASKLNPYHLESDVCTHTMMVCKQAENMSHEVKIAALLHDIGKPSTRAINPKNGRVSFYNHDAVSAFMALEILKRPELELDKEQIARIFNTIALHTQIYKLETRQLAKLQDLKLLGNLVSLGTADHEGRFHSHEGSELPSPGILSLMAIQEKNFEEKGPKSVTLMCGLPGSGKSTWVAKKENHDCFRVSRDEALMNLAIDKTKNFQINYNEAWRIIDQKEVDKELQRLFKEAKEYDNVIVDMTHMSKKSRRRSLSHFGKDYKKECIVFLTDLPTVYLTNEKRCGKIIERDVVDRMMRSFYPPTLEEFDDIKYIWR